MTTSMKANGVTGNIHKKIKDNPKILEPHLSVIDKLMESLIKLLASFGQGYVQPIRANEYILKSAIDIQNKHLTDIADSMHIATILYGGIRDILTFDRDIHNIDQFHSWCRY